MIFEWARFNCRNQLEGETAEQFIAVLYNLAETCNYGELKGEMIRDRLVVGIRDSALSERLLLDATLTLEKAKTAIRQKEAVHEQQDFLKRDTKANPLTLEAVTKIPQPTGRLGPTQKLCVAKVLTGVTTALRRMRPVVNVTKKDISVLNAFQNSICGDHRR